MEVDDSFYTITVFNHPAWKIGIHCAGVFKYFFQANYAVLKSVGLPGTPIEHEPVTIKYAVIEQHHYGLFRNTVEVIESWWYIWKPNHQQFEFIDYTPDEFKPGGRLHRESYGVS